MQRIGRYDVERELGQGGMGRVFVAHDPELKRSVALKLLHRTHSTQPALRELFRAEARALAALSHPGIVTIFEIGDHEGQQFIAMEYLEGRTLRELLVQAERAPKRDQLLAICASVGVAVAAAHAAGILHRDIKPENVVVGRTGLVKVVDFGMARRLDGEDSPAARSRGARATSVVDALTQTLRVNGTETSPDTVVTGPTGTVFGTPAYMAPEVMQGDPSSEASDVYSLGVMIYECLAGRRPYEAPDLYQLMARVVDGREPPAALADPLGPFVMRMLARDPAARPTLGELASALEPARPSARAAGRSRVPLVGAGTLVVIGLAVVATWQATSKEQVATAPRPARIAVQAIPTKLLTSGAGQPDPHVVGGVLATLLGTAERVAAISPTQLVKQRRPEESFTATASRLGASWLVRGTIDEHPTGASRSATLDARFELVDLTSGKIVSISESAPPNRLAALETQLSRAVATAVPGGHLPDPDHTHARILFDLGTAAMDADLWTDARVYFEQAVEIDPSVPEGWASVASVRGWSLAPDALIEEAIDHALEVTTSDTERQIWRGAKLVYRFEFAKAVATLTPLVARNDLDANARRDLYYYLGEAHFHDGDFQTGVAYLRKVLDRRVPFKPAAVHVAEYALAHRDYAEAMRNNHLDRDGLAQIELARGNYEQLARTDYLPFNLYAYVLLDRPPPAELEAAFEAAYPRRVGAWRLALTTGDRAASRRAFDAAWKDLATAGPNAASEELHELMELVVTDELVDETRELLDHLRASSRSLIWFRRYEILAAPLLGTPHTFPRDGLTTRDGKLATAIESELAGDRARAAALLAALVDDPSTYWDYPARAALARNLRALGRRRELAQLCDDTMHPAVFHYAWLGLRRICRSR